MILQVIWAIQENVPKLRSADQQSLRPFFKLPNMQPAPAVGLLHTIPRPLDAWFSGDIR